MITKLVQKYLQRHPLLGKNNTLIVAVSGGKDSLTLLHSLNQVKELFEFGLHVVTLDHGLRGEAGEEDAEFVVQTAKQWDLPCTRGKVNVHTIAHAQKLSIETAARNARYDFLAEVAHKVGAKCVAVAHHADDQAETVLMHLLRGSGLQGLRGMQFDTSMPNHPELCLIRPLLNVTRAQIDAYCEQHKLEVREDYTNQDVKFFRNQVRLEVLPYLGTINPQFNTALNRLAESVQVDLDFIEVMFDERVRPYIQQGEGRTMIDRAHFNELHSALQRRFVMLALTELNPQATYSNEQVIQAVERAMTGRVGTISQFPMGLRLRVDYQSVVIEKSGIPIPLPSNGCYLLKGTEIDLANPSTIQFLDAQGDSWQCVVTQSSENDNCIAQLSIPDSSKIKLRTRKAGDRFKPLGLAGSKKLKDWMIDKKIPQHLRDNIPLLVVNGEISLILIGDQQFIGEDYKSSKKSMHNVCFLIQLS